MEASRPARNGALKQVLSWTDRTHFTGLRLVRTDQKARIQNGAHYTLYLLFLRQIIISSLLLSHLNTLRITHVITLGSEHGSCSALKVRGSAALATLSCHSWGCFELLPWGHGSEMKGILHSWLWTTLLGQSHWLPLCFSFLFFLCG